MGGILGLLPAAWGFRIEDWLVNPRPAGSDHNRRQAFFSGMLPYL